MISFTHRFQRELWSAEGSPSLEPPPPGCLDLASWVQVLKAWSPEARIEVLELKSEADSQEQEMHWDSDFMATREEGYYKFATNEYSMILALEPQHNETYINVSSLKAGSETRSIRKVVIPQGALMIFRGDVHHGGGGYVMENRRLFFGIKTQSSKNQVLLLREPKKKRMSSHQPSDQAKRRSPRFSSPPSSPRRPEHEIGKTWIN